MLPSIIFDSLMSVMRDDNGCKFWYTEAQRLEAINAIITMQVAGYPFPKTPEADEKAKGDLDGVYWLIAAGEHSDMEALAVKVPGAAQLNDALNKIFDNPMPESRYLES